MARIRHLVDLKVEGRRAGGVAVDLGVRRQRLVPVAQTIIALILRSRVWGLNGFPLLHLSEPPYLPTVLPTVGPMDSAWC